MILFKQPEALKQFLSSQKAQNVSIGFVPTMGALHQGHLSLIAEAKLSCDLVVSSIFVNPTQFNNPKDLETYPRTIQSDIIKLMSSGCDVLFHPEETAMYAQGEEKLSSKDYGYFIDVLEGSSRPGHFDGVITILTKLFNMVDPNQVYFGQKDYQQCMVVETLIQRHFPAIIFNRCAIVREEDGLAMSSRNTRLSVEERKKAPEIYSALQLVQTEWTQDGWELAMEKAKGVLSKAPFELEYLEVCKTDTLEPLTSFQKPVVVLVAVNLGKTRLLDNLIIN